MNESVDKELLYVTNNLRTTFGLDENKAVEIAHWAIAAAAMQVSNTDRRVAEARIEEIEDISQSRDMVWDEGLKVFKCLTCLYVGDEEKCACDRLYDQRKQRLEKLYKELGR